MPVFSVEYTMHVVVIADDHTDAYQVARDAWREARSDAEPDICVDREVESEDDLPDEWDDGCIPYGGDGNTRLAEYLKSSPQAPKTEGERE